MLQRELIRLLCSFFFLGDSQHIEFSWKQNAADQWVGLGVSTLTWDGKILINMEPRDLIAAPAARDRKSRLIGILLHELCHTLLMRSDLYAYPEEHGFEREAARLLGITGHGEAWYLLACHVEIGARNLLPNLDIRLGIPESIEHERLVGRQTLGIVPNIRLRLTLTDAEWEDLCLVWPVELVWAQHEDRLNQELGGLDSDSVKWLKKWTRASNGAELREKVARLLQETQEHVDGMFGEGRVLTA